MIQKFFYPPRFDDEELNTRAILLNGVSWAAIGLSLVVLLMDIATDFELNTTIILVVLMVSFSISLILLRFGYVQASAIMLLIIVWIDLTFQAYTADGIRDVVILAYLALALLASFVINIRAALFIILLSIASIWGLAFLETQQLINPTIDSVQNYARDLTLIFLLVSVLAYYFTTSSQNILKRYKITTSELIKNNTELQELQLNLEQHIQDRTSELTLASEHNRRRADQFSALAEVTRALVSEQDFELLISRITQLISEKFGVYHIGLFLLDESRNYAVLSASNSEGGRRMIAREYKQKVGESDLIGYVTASGIPRIALDTGDNPVIFNDPELPETRSQLSLPLRVPRQIIGALDFQSVEVSAFSLEEIETYSILADQVALAIQNARAIRDTRKLLAEAQSAISGYVKESWRTFQLAPRSLGFQFSGSVIKPLSDQLDDPAILEVMKKGETVLSSNHKTTTSLTVPVFLRDQVIGVVNLQRPITLQWDPDQIDIAKAVAERLSLALETSTLIRATQHRAEIERVTSEITGKISSTTLIDSILQTAAQELSRALGGSDVLVKIEPGSLELSSAVEQ